MLVLLSNDQVMQRENLNKTLMRWKRIKIQHMYKKEDNCTTCNFEWKENHVLTEPLKLYSYVL